MKYVKVTPRHLSVDDLVLVDLDGFYVECKVKLNVEGEVSVVDPETGQEYYLNPGKSYPVLKFASPLVLPEGTMGTISTLFKKYKEGALWLSKLSSGFEEMDCHIMSITDFESDMVAHVCYECPHTKRILEVNL